MEIMGNDDEDTGVDTNSKYDIWSESGYHEGLDNDEPELDETLPPEKQGDPNSIVDDLYNQLKVEKDDYEFERIVDNYFKDGFFFLKASYVGDSLVEYNITEVWFEDLNKDVVVEQARYIKDHVLVASRRKGPFNAWAVKAIKGHTISIRRLYCVKEINRGYRL